MKIINYKKFLFGLIVIFAASLFICSCDNGAGGGNGSKAYYSR